MLHLLKKRPRRNRLTSSIRSLAEESILLPSHLVAPLFLCEGKNHVEPISSMPQIQRLSIDLAIKKIQELYALGIRAVDLFALIPQNLKNNKASNALDEENLICRAVQAIKREVPEMCLMVDIALDPYTDHGHDGLVGQNGEILNDETVDILCKMSLACAKAGADIVAPSDMMDGRVGAIRHYLDAHGFSKVGILAYSAKYASALYGPFREALQSAPKFGDKRTYQLNPANSREALREAKLDEEEGADMLLIKPATLYLDIIAKIREMTSLPIGAYHVSGEYAMVMAAAEKGWLDADRLFLETLISIRRAGADFILTYAAERIARQLSRQF